MPDIHVVSSTSSDWIIGWKAANIALASDMETLVFRSAVMGGRPYPRVANAECLLYQHRHQAPVDNCKCGFNAWDELEFATTYWCLFSQIQEKYVYRAPPDRGKVFIGSCVLLRVGLAGDVIEGTIDAGNKWQEWGYRASSQTVTDVFFDETCAVCDEDAHTLCAMQNVPVSDSDLYPLRNLCDQHIDLSERVLPLSHLSSVNDAGVHIGLPP